MTNPQFYSIMTALMVISSLLAQSWISKALLVAAAVVYAAMAITAIYKDGKSHG